jgi:hypothetical protein
MTGFPGLNVVMNSPTKGGVAIEDMLEARCEYVTNYKSPSMQLEARGRSRGGAVVIRRVALVRMSRATNRNTIAWELVVDE